jgi:hypothetical protein
MNSLLLYKVDCRRNAGAEYFGSILLGCAAAVNAAASALAAALGFARHFFASRCLPLNRPCTKR